MYNDSDYRITYWCWSRLDVDESTLKSVIIRPHYVEDYELRDLIFHQPFSLTYRFNGSHIQCNADKLWNDLWFSIDSDSTTSCVTNTSLPVNVKYHTKDDNL